MTIQYYCARRRWLGGLQPNNNLLLKNKKGRQKTMEETIKTKQKINKNLGTLSLDFAKIISAQAMDCFNKDMLNQVSPITAELLNFWFGQDATLNRQINFHVGQKKAIITIVYLVEVLKSPSIESLYKTINQEKILASNDYLKALSSQDYLNSYPSYLVKLATGTGKTFIINALLIWQYLNANKYPSNTSFNKNFLIIAPNNMVYDRLLQSFKGKFINNNYNFESCDMLKYKELFLPTKYQNEILSFIANGVLTKEDLKKQKSSSSPFIAITNYHQLMEKKEEVASDDYLTLKPNTKNSLDTLDNYNQYNPSLEFLKSVNSLCIFNDEAHHIYSSAKSDAKKWQEILNIISQNKIDSKSILQLDMSATPFITDAKHNKDYLAHIVVDFDFKEAVALGLVKMVTIHKKKEFAYNLSQSQEDELEIKAIRDEDSGEVLDIANGQRLMIRAGIKKLTELEDAFLSVDATKHPKMLIMCEDTKVIPKIEDFLNTEGLAEQYITIASNTKGEVGEKEWENIKNDVFNIDNNPKIKIIISVLMLREGFDVSNICVIVPLRASTSKQLVEQTIGRGLRLMWREKDYEEIKQQDRDLVLNKKLPPNSSLDILSIIEHPNYEKFYDDSLSDIIIPTQEGDEVVRHHIGDLKVYELKPNYQDYDLYFAKIIQEELNEVFYTPQDIVNIMEPFTMYPLSVLHKRSEESIFRGKEITQGTHFGEFSISGDLINSKHYHQFLPRILKECLQKNKKTMVGNNDSLIVEAIDIYIKSKLFNVDINVKENFNPQNAFNPDNEGSIKILCLDDVLEHIFTQIRRAMQKIYEKSEKIAKVSIKKEYFSSVNTLRASEKYLLKVSKSIFEYMAYPSHKGLFEKDFINFIDSDSQCLKFIKIDPHKHSFAYIHYFAHNNYLRHYYPDFILETTQNYYIVETKAYDNVEHPDTRHKQKAMIEYVNKLNLSTDKAWIYALVDDKAFYKAKNNNHNLLDLLNNSIILNAYKNSLLE